ncbi:MAG: transposase [Armatimonadetes bacterium]|nr:transposase [Armatimonadota bacterium]
MTCLLTDDGAAYRGISREAGLCWVHELRHLKKLRPSYPLHRRELQRVTRQAWGLYRDLQAYRAAPTPDGAAELRATFGRVFGQTVPYPALQARLRLTQKKAARLLPVLEHPELPLHNNAMELAARQRVRKRDVSYGPRSGAGARA